MAKQRTAVGSYDPKVFQQLMQSLADAAQEIDVYSFSNEIPPEHVQHAKDVVSNVSKQCTAALSRKAARIQVTLP